MHDRPVHGMTLKSGFLLSLAFHGHGGHVPPLLDRKGAGHRRDDRDGQGDAGGDEAPRGARPESGPSESMNE